MEFFTDHWVLWACFFVPAMLWLAASKLANSPLRGAGLARVVAYIAGLLLVFALIHVVADVFVDVLVP